MNSRYRCKIIHSLEKRRKKMDSNKTTDMTQQNMQTMVDGTSATTMQAAQIPMEDRCSFMPVWRIKR